MYSNEEKDGVFAVYAPLIAVILLLGLMFGLAGVVNSAEIELRLRTSKGEEAALNTDKRLELREELLQNRRPHRDDEIIVKFKGQERFTRVRVTPFLDVDLALHGWRGREDIEYAEPNYIANAYLIPNDPYYSYQWNFRSALEGGINVESAWDLSQGEGVIVAVIDTGVAYENYRQSRRNRYYLAPDLADTSFVLGYDFVNGDTHPNDDNGHGTHVTGTIAQSTNNNIGVAGIAYRASIMPIKVLDSRGSGTYADVAEGIRFAADNGANVINLSLGGSASATYLKDALEYAYNKGVVIAAASGNDGQGVVSYPAAYDEFVIAVGATRYDRVRAPYSNYGVSLDLVAPGGDTSVDQNGDGYGDGILQQTFGRRTDDWGYYFYQGTSMATPHVAAVAALLIANGNATTPDDVRLALESTAKDLGEAGKDTTYGYGLVDALSALGFGDQGGTQTPPTDDPPIVSITNPQDASTVNGEVALSAVATDDNGVLNIDFYVGSTLVGSDSTSPYSILWDSTEVSDGMYTIIARASDTASQTSDTSVTVEVKNITESVNNPPVIVSTPLTEASVGESYSYDVEAADPDQGDVLIYTLTTMPEGMTINSETGLVEWMPGQGSVGNVPVEVTVSDTGGLEDSQAFIISVSDASADPSEVVVLDESFESGLGNWVQDSQNDWFRSSQRATDGSYSVEVDGRARDAALTSQPLDLNGYTNVTVAFSWYIERRLDSGEYIAFDVSTDGGNTWTEYARLRGNVDEEDVWHEESVTLSAVDNLVVRFRGNMSSRSEDANVDSIMIVAK